MDQNKGQPVATDLSRTYINPPNRLPWYWSSLLYLYNLQGPTVYLRLALNLCSLALATETAVVVGEVHAKVTGFARMLSLVDNLLLLRIEHAIRHDLHWARICLFLCTLSKLTLLDLGCQLFNFRAWNIPFHAVVDFRSAEQSAALLLPVEGVGVFLCLSWSSYFVVSASWLWCVMEAFLSGHVSLG